MTSEVEICNLALSCVRAGSINSLDESSLQAQQCKLHYPFARDQTLEDAPWQFSRELKSLAVVSNAPVFNWNYSYQYPSDCLNIDRLVLNIEEVDGDQDVYAARLNSLGLSLPDLRKPVEYEIYNVDGVKIIAANEAELRIKYTKKVSDPNFFSTQFVLALANLLGSMVAVPIVGVEKGRPLKDEALQLYNRYINAAKANNENEQYRVKPDSDMVNVRS